ncbi:MAG: ORF6N domain-containing protein [Candidatus Stahlbacteria bacterium]|nr:ORF6N domain-containing protein [Candidatus Stahlbacteria bacterium]
MPVEVIQQFIFEIRGERVMIDRHLAKLYEVETRVLNQAVKRNIERFPEEFMFQLTKEERDEVITICDDLKPLRYAKTMPYAFTEYGVAMLSSVLKSQRAIQVNIQIIKAFVKLRKMLLSHIELRRKLEEMEKKYDKQFKVVFDVINRLLEPPKEPKKKIGFL